MADFWPAVLAAAVAVADDDADDAADDSVSMDTDAPA